MHGVASVRPDFDAMYYSLPGSSVHGVLQARILQWDHSHLQDIFSTQGSGLGLLHCRQTLHHPNHWRVITVVVSLQHYLGLEPEHNPVFSFPCDLKPLPTPCGSHCVLDYCSRTLPAQRLPGQRHCELAVEFNQ